MDVPIGMHLNLAPLIFVPRHLNVDRTIRLESSYSAFRRIFSPPAHPPSRPPPRIPMPLPFRSSTNNTSSVRQTTIFRLIFFIDLPHFGYTKSAPLCSDHTETKQSRSESDFYQEFDWCPSGLDSHLGQKLYEFLYSPLVLDARNEFPLRICIEEGFPKALPRPCISLSGFAAKIVSIAVSVGKVVSRQAAAVEEERTGADRRRSKMKSFKRPTMSDSNFVSSAPL